MRRRGDYRLTDRHLVRHRRFMNSAKKHDNLVRPASFEEDPELRRLNTWLDALERIARDAAALAGQIDNRRMDREAELRRKQGARKTA